MTPNLQNNWNIGDVAKELTKSCLSLPVSIHCLPVRAHGCRHRYTYCGLVRYHRQVIVMRFSAVAIPGVRILDPTHWPEHVAAGDDVAASSTDGAGAGQSLLPAYRTLCHGDALPHQQRRLQVQIALRGGTGQPEGSQKNDAL
jgi:hypothetical protein